MRKVKIELEAIVQNEKLTEDEIREHMRIWCNEQFNQWNWGEKAYYRLYSTKLNIEQV